MGIIRKKHPIKEAQVLIYIIIDTGLPKIRCYRAVAYKNTKDSMRR